VWLKGPWPARLRAAGVHVQAGLPVNLFRRRLHRIDLRNHRKITVIDGHIAYCGSQNLTDERVRTRRIPPRYRFWIDATCRIQGPAATALQAAFLADWLTSTDEASIPDIKDYLTIPKPHGTSIVHVVPSGPTSRVDAIHQSLVTMLSVAQREIMMTTPYFVPDAAIKAAIVSASLRGVQVTLILPEQLDNAIVAAAARAHYAELLEAGVRIFHHQGGLLHAKAAVVDGELAMIGSANLDMRSFWINFECTLLVYDAPFAQRVRDLHKKYLGESTEVSKPQWDKRTWAQNLRDNSAQLLAPLL
jgi:cardiolipin synthase